MKYRDLEILLRLRHLQRSFLHALVVAILSLSPVNNVPPVLQVGGLVVLVLEVPGMLPAIPADNRMVRGEWVLVLERDKLKAADLRKTEPAPARALDRSSSRVECRLKLLKVTKLLLNSLLQGAILQLAATLADRSHARPEKRVVNVTATVELDSALQLNLLGKVVRLEGLIKRLHRSVKVVHVGNVVLVVMHRHDFLRDEGFKGIVGVGEGSHREFSN